MKKKLCRIPISWLLAIAMLTALMPPAVSAEGTTHEVNGVYYSIINNTAVVTGCADNLTSVQVEDNVGGYAVTKVESGAFKDKTALRSVKIADGVTFIGEYAFSGCKNLSDISLSAELVDTGRYLFDGCTSLTKVVLPGKLTNLAEHAFANCISLKEVEIPASINNSDGGHVVRGEWFEGCTSLEKVTFAEGATRIPPRAFVDCKEIEIIIPDTLKSIGFGAFSGVDWIEDIDFIPESVEIIEGDAFAECPNIKTAVFPESAMNVQGGVLRGCPELREVTVNKNIQDAYNGYNDGGTWFVGCDSLEKVVFANGTQVIPNKIFVNCKEVELVIPDTVKTVKEQAFMGVEWVENLDFLPDSIETIEKNAFNSCKNLSDISKLGTSLRNIGEAAFADCDLIETVNFAEGLQMIGHLGFAGCDNLKSITLPQSLTHIYSGAFKNCVAIENIIIPKNVVNSGFGQGEPGWWFEGCTSLKNISIEDGATVIPEGAFKRLAGNVNIIIPSSVKQIQANAFAGNEALTSIVLPPALEAIEEKAFQGCTGLKSVYIPVTVNTIHENSFAGCADDLVVYCGYNATAADTMAAADIYYVYNGGRRYNSLFANATGFYADGSGLLTGGYVTLTAKYKINTAYAENPDPAEVKITIPGDCRLAENPVYVNSEPYSGYKVKGNVISVTGLPSTATVSVILMKEGARNIISRASLTFWSRKTSYVTQTLGTTCEPVRTISVRCDPYTNDGNVMVSGIATPESAVRLYVDGAYVAETVSNKAGSYKCPVIIPNPAEGQKYVIKAVIGNGEADSKETTVTYNPTMPSLVSAYLYPNNHMNPGQCIDLTEPGKIQTVEFWPVTSYTFEVKYTNSHLIEKVIITSVKGAGRKSIEAYYDAEKDAFVSNKLFEHNNPYYVPGDIEISYVRKYELTDENIEEIDKDLQEWVKSKDGEYLIKYNDLNLPVDTCQAVTMSPVSDPDKEMKVLYTENYEPNFNPNSLDAGFMYDSEQDGILCTGVTKEINGETYEGIVYHQFESDITYTILTVIDATTNYPFSIGFTQLGVFGVTVDAYTAIARLRNSDDPNKEQKIAEIEALYFGYMVACTAGVGIAVFGGGVPLVISFVCGWIVKEIIDGFAAVIGGDDIRIIALLRWLIDPSGYVYEGVTSNRIQGAKVTVYYKNPETGETVVWDAENYDQLNPLITNAEGRYSWVVPEGEWMVKCEMEGYDTVFTEWLPVPPPQMDVNIGLVSKAVPYAEKTEAAGNKVKVVFSKYMIPETLETVEFTDASGEILDYVVTYPITETDADGNVLARAYTFEFDKELEQTVTLKLGDGVKSYADIAAENKEIGIDVQEKLSEITAPESVQITSGGSRRIKLNVSGYTAITAESDMPSVALVEEITGSSEDGAFYAVVNTFSEGEAKITFRVPETGETVTTVVNSVSEMDMAVKEVVKSESGTDVQLLNTGADEFSGECVIAVYANDGQLINTVVEPFGSSESETTVSFDGFVPGTENYKIMIFKDMSMIAPVAYTY